MISFEIFLLGLLIVSTLTGLATEATKSWMTEHNKDYRANSLAGVVSLIVSLGVGVGYSILTNTPFTSHLVVYMIALIFLSWLCAMVGYDKVIQAISQFKTTKKEG